MSTVVQSDMKINIIVLGSDSSLLRSKQWKVEMIPTSTHTTSYSGLKVIALPDFFRLEGRITVSQTRCDNSEAFGPERFPLDSPPSLFISAGERVDL